MLRNFMATVALMAFTCLVVAPLSEGYDFLGEPVPKREPVKEQVKPEAPKKVAKPVKEVEELVEEQEAPKPKAPPKKKAAKSRKATAKIPAREEKLDFAEIEYSKLQSGNIWDNLPKSDSGNYVIIYSTNNCPYCVKLIDELKGNIDGYVLVVVKCQGGVRDLFYNRWVFYFPGYVVIKDKQARYYGYGYQSLERFKRYLQ